MNLCLENVNPAGHRRSWATQPEPAAGGSPIRVWVVDDDVRLGELLAALLDQAGGIDCSRVFASVDQVLEALAREPAPQVILLDLHLQGNDGVRALGVMKARALRTRIFIISTFSDSYHEARARQAGAGGLLPKYAVERILYQIRQGAPVNSRGAAP